MSKHTPGPWIVDDRFATCVRSPSGTVVANTDNADGVSNARLIAAAPELLEALSALVGSRAISGVREIVAGWNGENRPDGPYKERHPGNLGATLPKTTCGAVYALDEAMQAARAVLAKAEGRADA